MEDEKDNYDQQEGGLEGTAQFSACNTELFRKASGIFTPTMAYRSNLGFHGADLQGLASLKQRVVLLGTPISDGLAIQRVQVSLRTLLRCPAFDEVRHLLPFDLGTDSD